MNAETFLEQFETFAEAPNGIAKLRELVLQLAVQGKLVSHDVSADHSIEAEKAAAISTLGIGRHPETTPVDVTELPFVWPPNWIAVRLGDLTYSCPTAYGEAPSPGLVTLGVIKVGNVSNDGGFKGSFEERGFPFEEAESLKVREGDLIVVKSSGSAENVHSGKTAICRAEQDGLLVGTNFVMRLRRFGDSMLPEFLWRVLISRTTRAWVERTVQTMTYPNLKWSDYSQLPIALPPLAEQKRIVAKVDQLLALCDELAARQEARRVARTQLVGATLDRLVSTRSAADLPPHVNRLQTHFDHLFDTPTTIPKLRQTILQLAVQGQLVPQDPTDEPASVLLLRLPASESVSSPHDPPHELPDTWAWTTFNRVATIASNLVPPSEFADFPHVAPDNIEKGTGRLLSYKTVGEDGVRSSNHRFYAGQLVYSKIRPNLSKVTIVDFDGLCSADMYPINSHIDSEYLLRYMLSQTFLGMAVRNDTRVAMPKINQEELNRVLVALPPLAEQKRIVAKVTELLSLCDTLEAQLQTAESASSQLLSAAVHHLLRSEDPAVHES